MSGAGAGVAYLVGAGPGDPGLLTLRGAEALARAGAVIREPGVDRALLSWCGPEVERIEVEALSTSSVRSPAAVASRLGQLVRHHGVAVYLIDGDPFLEPRGVEVAQELANQGVRFEVVPGLHPAMAVPTFAGIPPAPADAGGAIVVLGGAAANQVAGGATSYPWQQLLRGGTLIASASAAQLEGVVHATLAGGVDPQLSAALVVGGATSGQRTWTTTLAEMASSPDAWPGSGEAVLVVGPSVRRRGRLGWFESRPLFGRRVVVTRPRSQASGFVAGLEELGAEVIHFPTIRIEGVADPEQLQGVAAESERFDWIVFTSVNGVSHFWTALAAVGRDSRSLKGVSVCAIGPVTAAALEMKGVVADLVPERFVAEAVVEALARHAELRGARILLPRAELARSVLPDELREHGAEVVDVVAYRTVPDATEAGLLRARLDGGEIDLITFTSSSTVQNFVKVVGSGVGSAEIASIGPVTSATAREVGLVVAVEAEEYTVPGLIAAIREHYASGRHA